MPHKSRYRCLQDSWKRRRGIYVPAAKGRPGGALSSLASRHLPFSNLIRAPPSSVRSSSVTGLSSEPKPRKRLADMTSFCPCRSCVLHNYTRTTDYLLLLRSRGGNSPLSISAQLHFALLTQQEGILQGQKAVALLQILPLSRFLTAFTATSFLVL